MDYQKKKEKVICYLPKSTVEKKIKRITKAIAQNEAINVSIPTSPAHLFSTPPRALKTFRAIKKELTNNNAIVKMGSRYNMQLTFCG
jgi:predicted RND superfamily exporter protein